MKKKVLNALKYLMFLGLGIFLVWWSIQQIPDDKWDDFVEAFSSANYLLLLPVFCILTISHLLRAYRWKLLIAPMGYSPAFTNTFFSIMIGYLANLAVPRLGEVLRCTILAKYEHVPADKLIGTIVAERAFDVLCLGIVFIIALSLQFDVIGTYAMELLNGLFKGNNANIGNRIGLSLLIITGVFTGLAIIIKMYPGLRFVKTIKGIVKGIWQGVVSIRYLENKWMFIVSSLGIWSMYLVGTWVGFYGTAGTAGLSFEVAVSALAFASIGMIITPGGIGAYAYFLAMVLLQNNIAFEQGFANGTLQWFAQFLIILIVGFISLLLLPYFNKKKNKDEKARVDS